MINNLKNKIHIIWNDLHSIYSLYSFDQLFLYKWFIGKKKLGNVWDTSKISNVWDLFSTCSWVLCSAAPWLVQMWLTWRYLQHSGSGTPLSVQRFTEDKGREGGGERENAMEEWRWGNMIPDLSDLVTDMSLSLRCYGDGGREHPGVEKACEASWATIQDKCLRAGPKSTFMFVVLQYSDLPWC